MPVVAGVEVIRWAGGGGMGEVWQALQLAEQRVVALKVMRPLSGSPADRRHAEERFRREIAVAAQFDDPALARVFGSGVAEDGRLFYLMEWVEGDVLTDFLEKVRPALRERVRLGEALCRGVACLHAEGFVHRDLKPSNILVLADGMPKIIDLGLARSLIDGEMGMTLSREGTVIGTPGFMAPEQAAGELRKIGLPTDVWTLGVLLYYLATGRWPIAMEGGTGEVLARVLTAEPARPRVLDRKIPHDLEAILLYCLAREPSSRYPNAEALAEDLRHYEAGEPVSARGATLGYVLSKAVKRHRSAVTLVAGAAVALLGFGAWHWHVQRRTNEQLRTALDEAMNLRSFLLFDLRWDFERSGQEDILTGAALRAGEFARQAATAKLPSGARFDARRFEALSANLRGQAAAFRENLAEALSEFEAEHALNRQLAAAYPDDSLVALDQVASAANVAALLFRLERPGEVPSLLDEAFGSLERVGPGQLPPESPADSLSLLGVRLENLRARACRETGRWPEAEAASARAWKLLVAENPIGETKPELAILYASTRLEEARIARGMGQWEHAIDVLRDVLPRIEDETLPPAARFAALATNRSEIALALSDGRRFDEVVFWFEQAGEDLGNMRKAGYFEPSMWREREIARLAQQVAARLLDERRFDPADDLLRLSARLLQVRYHRPAAMRVPNADLIRQSALTARTRRFKGDFPGAALSFSRAIDGCAKAIEDDPDDPAWLIESADHCLSLAGILHDHPRADSGKSEDEYYARAARELEQAAAHPKLTADQHEEIARHRTRLPSGFPASSPPVLP